MKIEIAILLATYNSSKYLEEQLDSLFSQTYSFWTLYVRDDCSSDNTISILNKYIAKYPSKIVLLDNHNTRLGAYLNFTTLLKEVNSEYYMFCDHDDVWLDNKIENTVACMDEVEKNNSSIPLLIHTDMIVVDKNLEITNPSFWQSSRLFPDLNSFKDLVACNCVNGCTMLFNKLARDAAINNIDNCLMHDVLLAETVASNSGVIYALKEATVLYRQHGNNVLGAPEVGVNYIFEKIIHFSYVIKNNIKVWRMACKIHPYPFVVYLFYKLKIQILRLSRI